MTELIKRILYITSDDIYVHLRGDCIVLKQEGHEIQKIPIHAIELIIIMGNVTVSSYLIKKCSENNIGISYIDVYGNFIGRFYGRTYGNVSLRRSQYSLYENRQKSLELCRNIILGKALNSANLLKYYSRSSKNKDIALLLYEKATTIVNIAKALKTASSIDEVRGVEGSISSVYFSCFDLMLKTSDKNMIFETRSKRPPQNNCNALLSLFYTLFTTNVTGALESFGLDSQLGYMHRIRSGRVSLSCDMIEEFRSPIVDKFIIKIINLGQASAKDFEVGVDGIKVKKESLKILLKHWEKFRNEEIFHPLLKKKIKIKLIPYIQSQFLAQYIRGDIEEYPPFYYQLS